MIVMHYKIAFATDAWSTTAMNVQTKMALNILGFVTRAIRTTAFDVLGCYSASIVTFIVRTAKVLWTVVLLDATIKILVLTVSKNVGNAIETGVDFAETLVSASIVINYTVRNVWKRKV